MPANFPLGHRFTPEDEDRRECVHRLITTMPDAFKQAGTNLNAIPHRDGSAYDAFDHFESARKQLRDEHQLGVQPLSWDRAARVLLLTWVAFDDRAAYCPRLTKLQALPCGSSAWLFPHGANSWFEEVDAALALATRRLSPLLANSEIKHRSPPQSPDAAKRPLGDTEAKIVEELRAARKEGRGMTAKQLGTACSRSEDAINRAVKRLGTKGYVIRSTRNRAGYSLVSEPSA